MDVFTPERRSEIMARIRSGDTQPELAVRRYLHARGLRFRVHRTALPGKPDIVLPRYQAAIYVNGCFWHGHSCKDGRRPKSNTQYWDEKLDRNLARDRELGDRLAALEWRRIVVWECESKDPEVLERLVDEVRSLGGKAA